MVLATNSPWLDRVRLRTLLAIFALSSAIVCLEFFIQPGFWISVYGGVDEPQARFLYRLLGAVFGGFAVMAWNARKAGPSSAREAMVRGLVAVNLLVSALAVSAALSGIYNQFAWGAALAFGAFGIGFLRATDSTYVVRTSDPR